MSAQPILFTNVRLVDPASGYEGPGAVLVKDGLIADVVRGQASAPSADIRIIDGKGAVLSPGLVDLRVKTGEPGS
jgi:dihydroorotase